MKNSKGLKALGLSILAVLGMMAFSAVGAQAQLPNLPGQSTAGTFLVLDPGVTLPDNGTSLLAVNGLQTAPGHLIVPGRSLIIGCNTGHVESATLHPTVVHAEIRFLECGAWAIKKTANVHIPELGAKLPCLILSDDGKHGEIRAKAKIKAIKHGGVEYVLAEPLEGTSFTLFTFHAGTGCPLPLTTHVSGSVGAEINQGQVEHQLLEFTGAIQLLLADKLLYGTFESFIDGHAEAEIEGPPPFELARWGVH